jgi:hypothetical protein
MKVTILTPYDFASSGLKICEAVKRNTDIDIEIYAGDIGFHVKEWKMKSTPTTVDRQAIQKRILESHVIHIKGDYPPMPTFMGFKLHDNIVTTVSGSGFRKNIYGGREEHRYSRWQIAKVRTSFEPDLLYPEYGNIWTPHPIDCGKLKDGWKPEKIFLHTPSNRFTKNTPFVEKVFAKLQKYGYRTLIIGPGIEWKKVVELRKTSLIYFGQFMVGFYGNSEIEAMQFGVPVANWISPLSIAQGYTMKSPVLSWDLNVDKWVNEIMAVVEKNGKLEEISEDTREYCKKYHSYEAVAKQWEKIYRGML